MGVRAESSDRWGSFVWGLGLITVGVVLLLHFMGVLAWAAWGVWWPGIVIFFGLLQLLTARRPRKIGGAVTLALVGGWMLVATNGWYGLGWSHSWPLALVAVGVGTIARAIAASVMGQDGSRDCCREKEVEVDALP